jgi:HK97 family phage major capsid protein
MNIKALLAKKAKDLTDAEKAFLKEHVSEITDDADKKAYADILAEDSGIDIESAKALLQAYAKEAISAAGNAEKEAAMAKKIDELSNDLVGKFMAGVDKQRAKALDGNGETDEGKKKAGEVTRKFMKALLAGDKEGCKALSTSDSGQSPDDAQAGLLIPTELRNEVLRIAEKQYGLARRDMFYLPFSGPGNSRTIPTLGTSVTVKWTGELAKKQSTQPGFSLITQTLKKLAAIVPFTEEILEDSAINLLTLIAELFAEAVAKEEDLQFFAGTGAPWTGILNNAAVNIVIQASGAASQVTADDLLDMIDATPSGALAGAKFYMHRTVLSKVRKLKDLDGNYIFQNPGGGLPKTIWDYPYETTDAFPALSTVTDGEGYILFGNLKQGAVFGDKQQLRVKTLDQATITDTDGSTVINLAEQDAIALRIVERVGYVVSLAKALTVLQADALQS